MFISPARATGVTPGTLRGNSCRPSGIFWRRSLADVPPLLALPTDRPRPDRQTYHGDWHRLQLSVPLTRRIRELAVTDGGTLFMVLLTVFDVVLARYAGQHDIVVGAPIAGRGRTEFEGLKF